VGKGKEESGTRVSIHNAHKRTGKASLPYIEPEWLEVCRPFAQYDPWRTERGMRTYVTMITRCESCGHKLWSEEREVACIRFVLYFDDEERSNTYAEHVTECPGCGLSLLSNASKPKEHSCSSK
jgi:hypothetical protein